MIEENTENYEMAKIITEIRTLQLTRENEPRTTKNKMERCVPMRREQYW